MKSLLHFHEITLVKIARQVSGESRTSKNKSMGNSCQAGFANDFMMPLKLLMKVWTVDMKKNGLA